MDKEFVSRLVQVSVFTLALFAVCKEIEKPKEERKWFGKVAGIVPYDFRRPTVERLQESYWNPYETRVLTPGIFGVGWAINFYALLENLGFFESSDVSEERFLMPSQTMREVLHQMTE